MDYFAVTTSQLGVHIRNARKKAALTQKELAEKTGLLPKTISLLENSPENSRIDNLFRVASVLDLEIHLVEKSDIPVLPENVEW